MLDSVTAALGTEDEPEAIDHTPGETSLSFLQKNLPQPGAADVAKAPRCDGRVAA